MTFPPTPHPRAQWGAPSDAPLANAPDGASAFGAAARLASASESAGTTLAWMAAMRVLVMAAMTAAAVARPTIGLRAPSAAHRPDDKHAVAVATDFFGTMCPSAFPPACRSIHLPMVANKSGVLHGNRGHPVPRECLPRTVLLPSYPTSGSALVRDLYFAATGTPRMTRYGRQNHKTKKLVRKLVLRGASGLDIWIDTSTTSAHKGKAVSANKTTHGKREKGKNALSCKEWGYKLPLGRASVLLKTHFPAITKDHQESREYDSARWFGDGFAGVMRLARNPGDHILRNHFRWGHRDCRGECFFAHAQSSCGSLMSQATKWLKFHDFWNAYDPSVPRMLVRYEDVLDSCPTQVDRMLAFANATSASDAAKACEEVRPVDYEHGTLVKRVCGIDAARRLDKVVGRVARELGYAFDHASGVWRVRSLP